MGAKEWFVWDGDQVLYEVRESDTPWVGPGQYGRVGYTHAFGIDRPLELIKDGSLVVVPHANYRGQFDSGTEPSGAQYSCAGGYFSGCTEVAWAGADLRAFLQRDGGPPSEWLGSLAAGHRDQSGNIYMRNRQYDPGTGRFTQQDPIGLAGGLNLYGFAGGDPVNFSDPFGLCPDDERDEDGNCPGGITVREWQRVEYAANNYLAPEARDRVLELLNAGRIHGAVLSKDDAAAQTNFDRSVTLNRSDRDGRSTFEYAANNLAFVMAHESQHVEQFSGLGGLVNKVLYGLGIRRRAMEADAFAYACAYVKDKNSGYRPVCVGR